MVARALREIASHANFNIAPVEPLWPSGFRGVMPILDLLVQGEWSRPLMKPKTEDKNTRAAGSTPEGHWPRISTRSRSRRRPSS
jgi:hypothetical protein